MSLSYKMNTDMTPQPPKRGCLHTAAVFISIVTKLKFKIVAEDIVRGQFPLSGGQGVCEGEKPRSKLINVLK
ncbi:MAG: hypothetical protein EA393_13600 [Bacteroidetes bacterium]|nr:MAG: hypothetical protein EA393_13600 [Bacteroidota bacterium]